MNPKVASLLGLFGLLGLLAWGGCAAVPEPAKPPAVSFANPMVQNIVPDDPVPVFRKVFPDKNRPVRRDPLETTPEFAARVAALGVSGTYVFEIPPEQCHVLADADHGIYFIGSKDYYPDSYAAVEPGLYGITVTEFDEPPYAIQGVNKYGIAYEETKYESVEYKLRLANLSALPPVVLGRDEAVGWNCFGLRVRTDDAGFRQRLKEGKVGLAVRVRIDDLSRVAVGGNYNRNTFNLATKSYTTDYLPVTLLEVWIVDTSTQLSIFHWAPASP
ncbi:MAG: hypothetical protein JSS11_08945 [Verrucomicrobia bacterium]|nr:hypothetical protein [Verrucomicrobiota bacterium]